MKKEILITIGAVCGTTSVVAAGVFLPSIFLTSSPSTIQIDSSNSLISSSAKSSISVKEALLGTSKINNGNYVLYFGSEGIDSNFKFLYDFNIASDIELLKENQMSNRDRELSGNYWKAINYILNNEYSNENIGTKPKFLAYVNSLGASTIASREEFAKEVNSCLQDVLNARDSYSKSSDSVKDEILQKFNFVKNNLKEDSYSYKYVNYPEITSFFAALNDPFSKINPEYTANNPDLANKSFYDAVNWTITSNLVKFKLNPFETYSSWDSQTKYYDKSSYANEFRDLWNFVKNYPLFSSRVKDLNESDGLIVGYKNGQLLDFYSGSFNPEKTEDETETPDDSTTESQSINFSDLRASQITNNVIPEPTSNDFYSWLKTSYPVE